MRVVDHCVKDLRSVALGEQGRLTTRSGSEQRVISLAGGARVVAAQLVDHGTATRPLASEDRRDGGRDIVYAMPEWFDKRVQTPMSGSHGTGDL